MSPNPKRRSDDGPHILVVEDDAAQARALCRLLRARGHRPVVVADVAAASAALLDRSFDLVVADVRLPDGTGLEVLAHAHTRDPGLPVVIMTAAPTVETATEALENGALRYLTKPVVIDELCHVIASGLRFRSADHSDSWAAVHRAERQARQLDEALARLYLVYQPVVSWADRAVHAYEALLRRGGELASPAQIITTAERLGRIAELGRAVRARAAADAAQLPAGVELFINLHPLELRDPELYDPDAPLSAIAHRVVLEITERSSLDDLADADTRVARLRSMGYRIAVDDLGAGYASLSMLAVIRPEVVKFDRSLVHGLRRDPTRQMVLRTLQQMCAALGVTTVAEGVETADELVAVLRAGADLVQGWLVARPAAPAPAVDFAALDQVAPGLGPRATAVLATVTGEPAWGAADLGRTLCRDVVTALDAIGGLAGCLSGASADQVADIASAMQTRAGAAASCVLAMTELFDGPS